jgi:bifunctional UDP-N-acetylglucosamine pyrophosphorylase/glucosamine-1-phosphate N-acetyltransferase
MYPGRAGLTSPPDPMTPPSVVILAAGKGKRMLSSRPKVLHPIAGKPLLGHVLDTAQALSAPRVIVVYGHGGEAVPEAFAQSGATFVLQEPQLGTGHALMQALPHLPPDGTTLVLYGDVPLTRKQTLERVLSHPGALCLVTAMLDDPTGYGRILRDAAGAVTRIVEEKDATAEDKRVREINTGIVAAPTAALREWLSRLTKHNAQGEYYLTDIVPLALAGGMPVVTETVQQEWEVQGVNSREQLAQLERRYQMEVARRLMAGGVTLADPARLDVRGELTCAQDVSIDVGCIFEGRVRVGSNVVIGPHCVIKDTDIAPGAVVAAFSHLDGATIGPDCRVGPYARLRRGAALAAHARVGNFVEMKNTALGEGSKANHLSYLGDTVVGRDVNIGAGTITCNYDGANKHRTVIEDGAFIGSDTALVAPVTVGRGATIGAGSVITEDAPAGELSVARGRQVTVKGWKRPKKNP